MFPKLLLTVLLVAIVWFGFQYLQRLAEFKHRRDRIRRGTAEAPPRRQAESGVQDLVKCPVCDTWQAGSAKRRCNRADCPY